MGNEGVSFFFLSQKYEVCPSTKYSSVMVFLIDDFDRHWVWICTFCVRVVILEYTSCPVLLMLHYFSDMTKQWDLTVSMLKLDLLPCMVECFVKWSRSVDDKIICSSMLYRHNTLQNKVSGACLAKQMSHSWIWGLHLDMFCENFCHYLVHLSSDNFLR